MCTLHSLCDSVEQSAVESERSTQTVARQLGRCFAPGTCVRCACVLFLAGRVSVAAVLLSLFVCLFLTDLNTNIVCPLSSTWPHLNSDVGLEEGEY